MSKPRRKLIKNAFYCKKCKTLVESKSRHDFARCKCGNFTDGGLEYVRRGTSVKGSFDDMEDRCEWEDIPEEKDD